MSYKLSIQLEAIVDIKNAYDWYEDKRIGLGEEFILEIEECYNSISIYPERYGFVRGSSYFRRIRVFRFPYIIVYEVFEEEVSVTCISHIRQDRTYI